MPSNTAPKTNPNNPKTIQLVFGWPSYRGNANKSNSPPEYYALRTFVNQCLHWNGYLTTAILIQSGGWDSLVARITHSEFFPTGPAGGPPPFPRPAHPNPWTGTQCIAMVNFIKELHKVCV